ncbi:protein translocase subunit SecF [Candidatus Nomurabacteria bacterium]|nr:protein translocase subunit SecF [Candidatus Nomurabacteria bacterium]
MIDVIKNRKIPFYASGAIFIASVIALLVYGLKPGIDFTGGTLLEVEFEESRPTIADVQDVLLPLDMGGVVVQPTGERGMILKMRYIDEVEHQQVLDTLRDAYEIRPEGPAPTPEELAAQGESGIVLTAPDGSEQVIVKGDNGEAIEAERFNAQNKVNELRIETIGPSVSSQLREKAFEAAFVVILVIILYVAYAFRKVSKPVSSWKYGITAIIALIHDVTITMAVFAFLGKFSGVEVDIPFVVALLTILGYSVNDTIVVFDRVRENLIKDGSEKFAQSVNNGVNQTLVRSLNTSLTTLVVLLALFLFGGDSIHYFSLALIIGIILGTYSSIFLASPLLVTWHKWKK